MPHIKKRQIPNCVYFVTTTTFERRPFFHNEQYCRILTDDIKYYREKLFFLVLGYVILPDHLHMLILTGWRGGISRIMQRIKGHSSHQINIEAQEFGPVWKADFYSTIIVSRARYNSALNYVHNNPVKHGYAASAADWKYSSYQSIYKNDHSVIRVDKLKNSSRRRDS